MPKGMTIRRPQPLEMHATVINIPEGADILEAFTARAEATGYMPLVILSGMGMMSKAVLRVPNDEALPEITDSDEIFGIKIGREEDSFPEVRDLPVPMLKVGQELPEQYEPIPEPDLKPKPHWTSVQTFDHPLALLYAFGAKRKESSESNIHFIVSGSKQRRTGIAESFVGQLLPGCVAMAPMQFIVGIKPTLSQVTVQGWTVSIEPGYEVMEKLEVFLNARQNAGHCFFLSAIGILTEAKIANLNESGEEEVFDMPAEQGPYRIEEMSAIIDRNNSPKVLIHAAIVLNDGEKYSEAAGGRLIHGIVSPDEGNLDFFVGEMIEEIDIHGAM